MKRATNEDPTWRKHRRCNLPHTSATALLDRPWAERAHSITNWIESVPESAPYCNSFDSSTADSAQVLDSMSDSSRRRERRHRSCSPILKCSFPRDCVAFSITFSLRRAYLPTLITRSSSWRLCIETSAANSRKYQALNLNTEHFFLVMW
jgi:hypothetical protein